MIQDEIRLALEKRGYTHVDIQWCPKPDWLPVERVADETFSSFPMYLQPDGLLSRVMVTISIGGKPVLYSSTTTIERYWHEWGEEKFVQCINVVMGRYDLNMPDEEEQKRMTQE